MRLPQDDAEERDTSPLFRKRTENEAIIYSHNAGWNKAIEAAACVAEEAHRKCVEVECCCEALLAAPKIRALKRTP